MFTMRTTKPQNIPYYIRKANGGYSDACLGKPTDPKANVLANCVGYANGRFAEIIGKPCIEYQLVCNAENFIERAMSMGLKISSKPTLGGIMVWQKGSTLGGKDGAGHVCVVEQIISDNKIITSESGYNAKNAFWTQTRTKGNGNWGQSAEYKFRGCIINPGVNEGYWLNGYDYSPVFDPEYYRANQPDVAASPYGLTDQTLWMHFCTFGMNELRQGSAEFNAKAYKANYKDLRDVFGDNNPMYYYHYVVCGKSEGRIAV
jgi:hypothetical protein